eukprot:TRINITY_DN1575_c3_g1_i1.p1 TRINITY_DN1575_c3_g1~~TRINITY_DN1575_c3_g1_i1.p1  ORF type:complete len:487 (+),score=140.91 TRINITY_DN1575_c3_g1_i1:88-1461(+)
MGGRKSAKGGGGPAAGPPADDPPPAAAAESPTTPGDERRARKSASSGNKEPPKKSASDLLSRTIWTVVMAIVFLAVMYIGQTPGIALVLVCQVMMFREIMLISRRRAMEKKLPGFWALPWWMLFTANIWLLSRNLKGPLVRTWPQMEPMLAHCDFVALCLYMVGFASFVLSLRPTLPGVGRLMGRPQPSPKAPPKAPKQVLFRYQFGQWAWMHMTLITICLLSSFFMQNMMYGMFWFTLPATLVIHNDSWAYACGKSFGRTKLIPQLSPKKTWEGFLGAWFFTTLWAWWFSGFLSRHKRFTCPKEAFLTQIDCTVADHFLPAQYNWPQWATDIHGYSTFEARPVQFHALGLAAFASLFAPFGGFFASGLKRAFNLKDFGDLIPGHGGMVDRMDCQLLNALFVFCYISNFVSPQGGVCGAAGVITYCVKRMDLAQQVKLYKDLGAHLLKQGALPGQLS